MKTPLINKKFRSLCWQVIFGLLLLGALKPVAFAATPNACGAALREVLEDKLKLEKADIDSIIKLAEAENSMPIDFFADLVSKLPDLYHAEFKPTKWWHYAFYKGYNRLINSQAFKVLGSQNWSTKKEKQVIVDTVKYMLTTEFSTIMKNGNKTNATASEALAYQFLTEYHLHFLKTYAGTESFSKWVNRISIGSNVAQKWYEYMDPSLKQTLREQTIQAFEVSKTRGEDTIENVAVTGLAVKRIKEIDPRGVLLAKINDLAVEVSSLRRAQKNTLSPFKKYFLHTRIKPLQLQLDTFRGIAQYPSRLENIVNYALFFPKLGVQYAPATIAIFTTWVAMYYSTYAYYHLTSHPVVEKPIPEVVEIFGAKDIETLDFPTLKEQEAVAENLEATMQEIEQEQ